MKKTFIFGLLAAVLGFSSCCDGDSISGGTDDDVKDVPVEGVTVNVSAVELTLGDDPAQATTTLTATIVPENATNKAVTWSSSDENVATVTAEGIVTAVNEGTATITATTKEGGKSASCIVTVVKAAPAEDSHLLPGSFTVNAEGKKVKFTKSNLYWSNTDSQFHFEAKPTDYPTTRDQTHVGHFFWTKTAAASYAASYSDGENLKTDKFFADGSDADHKLTVDGISGLYVLSAADWTYLLSTRENASNLMKYGVKVKVGEDTYAENCLIIAPNDPNATSGNVISTEAEPTLELAALEAKGYVILPNAGEFYNGKVSTAGQTGRYWSSTPCTGSKDYYKDYAQYLLFDSRFATMDGNGSREFGFLIRAVLAE